MTFLPCVVCPKTPPIPILAYSSAMAILREPITTRTHMYTYVHTSIELELKQRKKKQRERERERESERDVRESNRARRGSEG